MSIFKKDGFTLMELLVVVLIVGILASFAIPYYRRAVEVSRAAEALNIFGVLEKGIQMELIKGGSNALFDPRKENQAVFNRMTVGISNLYQGEKYVCSKDFMYQIDCNKWNDYTCTAYAYRVPDDRRKPDRCRTVSMERTLYTLALTVPMNGKSTRCWTYWNNASTDFATDIGTLLTEDGKVDGQCAFSGKSLVENPSSKANLTENGEAPVSSAPQEESPSA